VASELVRSVWCDAHAKDTDTRVPVSEAGEAIPIRVGELSGVVDLCDACIEANVAPIAEFVETYARPAKPATPGPKKPDGASRFTCSECGKIYSFKNSLASHTQRAHGRLLGPSKRGGPPVVCPHCSQTMGSAPGLAQHIKANHPERWTGKLADSL